jgi:hypothetical protein
MQSPQNHFTASVAAYGSDEFNALLSEAITALGLGGLPLQQGLSCGSYASDSKLRVIIIETHDLGDALKTAAGLFYTSTIPGCNCSDDPTPEEEYTEYCEIQLLIDKTSGLAEIMLSSES